MKAKILLIGCGSMGFALLKGWMASAQTCKVWVIDRGVSRRELAQQLGAQTAGSPTELPETFEPDLLFLAVKPQVMNRVLLDYRCWIARSTTVVSIAAGLTTRFYEQALPAATAVLRCMPNTPVSIGEGTIVCYANSHVSPAGKSLTEKLLSSVGSVFFVEDENMMHAVTALSGSGPAYVFHFIDALGRAGESAGLPPALASKLALQTVYGAAALARQSGVSLTNLIAQVTSPAGTTAAGLKVLGEDDSMMQLVAGAVAEARKRSVELSKSNGSHR
jgi:pyrroline-5-carboxylate reductase